MFVGIVGLIMFFMLSGAFRAAGDPRTPLRLGLAMTMLTIALNVTLIQHVRHHWRRLRHGHEQHAGECVWRLAPDKIRLGDSLRARHGPSAGLGHHSVAFQVRASRPAFRASR